MDTFGNDVVRGYGVCHLPVVNGQSSEKMIMFVPESSSTLQKLTSWLTGKRPEYVDARLLARGDGREVTRVRSQGCVWIQFNVVFKDFHHYGFENDNNS